MCMRSTSGSWRVFIPGCPQQPLAFLPRSVHRPLLLILPGNTATSASPRGRVGLFRQVLSRRIAGFLGYRPIQSSGPMAGRLVSTGRPRYGSAGRPSGCREGDCDRHQRQGRSCTVDGGCCIPSGSRPSSPTAGSPSGDLLLASIAIAMRRPGQVTFWRAAQGDDWHGSSMLTPTCCGAWRCAAGGLLRGPVDHPPVVLGPDGGRASHSSCPANCQPLSGRSLTRGSACSTARGTRWSRSRRPVPCGLRSLPGWQTLALASQAQARRFCLHHLTPPGNWHHTFPDVGDLWIKLDRALPEGPSDLEVRPCLAENLPSACLSAATACHPA